MSIDLESYFTRIGWRGATSPGHATLAGLLAAHMAAIPFENLDVLLGRGVRLDLPGVQAKLVAARRGGYCFEHATLFAAVLDRLGFRFARHAARVVVFTPRHESPRTHMFLVVELPEGRFVVDPGFGALAPRVPVPVAERTPVHAGEEMHWMARDGPLWILCTRDGERDVQCWISPLEEDNLIDFEMGNHFTATYPASPFVNRLMLRALTPAGRVGVMNRDVTVRSGHRVERSVLADRAALRAVLRDHFGFDLPEVERLRVPSIPEWT